MATLEEIEKAVRDKFGEVVEGASEFRGELTLVVRRDAIRDVAQFLRDEPTLRFDYLSDLTAVDYLNMGRVPRFDVVYHLMSVEHLHRLGLKVAVPEKNAHLPSVTAVWPGANWHEREVYDMFGLTFDDHPSLTRILMPDDWEGHPLRKDFPVGGAPSFYFKRDTNERAGEPKDLVPRVRVQDSDI